MYGYQSVRYKWLRYDAMIKSANLSDDGIRKTVATKVRTQNESKWKSFRHGSMCEVSLGKQTWSVHEQMTSTDFENNGSSEQQKLSQCNLNRKSITWLLCYGENAQCLVN